MIRVGLRPCEVRSRKLGQPAPTVAPSGCDSSANDEDRYGRLLRYVETDDGNAGAILISEGHAYSWTPTSAPAPERLDSCEDATAAAREAGAGAWEDCPDLEGSR